MVCQRHRLPSSLFYTWRKQYRFGELTGFASVEVVSAVPGKTTCAPMGPHLVSPSVSAKRGHSSTGGMIEATLPGGLRLRIPADVNGTQLAMVIAALRQS
jgi:hypothetical protein